MTILWCMYTSVNRIWTQIYRLPWKRVIHSLLPPHTLFPGKFLVFLAPDDSPILRREQFHVIRNWLKSQPFCYCEPWKVKAQGEKACYQKFWYREIWLAAMCQATAQTQDNIVRKQQIPRAEELWHKQRDVVFVIWAHCIILPVFEARVPELKHATPAP